MDNTVCPRSLVPFYIDKLLGKTVSSSWIRQISFLELRCRIIRYYPVIPVGNKNSYIISGADKKNQVSVCGLMVLILDGNCEIGAHVRSNLCYLTYLRTLISSRVGTNRIFLSEKTYIPSCVRTCSVLPSNKSTMDPTFSYYTTSNINKKKH